MYQLIFYVPEENAGDVKQAVFAAGGGTINNYANCCWQCSGTGQFKPLSGSKPHIGITGKVEYVQELKIEMVVADEHIKNVINALKEAHPYEQPAYSVIKLENF